MYPLQWFSRQLGFRQQAGKQFQAAQRITDFMRQQSRHFGQGFEPLLRFTLLFQFRIRRAQLFSQPRHVPLQLGVRLLQGSRSFGERRESFEQALFLAVVPQRQRVFACRHRQIFPAICLPAGMPNV